MENLATLAQLVVSVSVIIVWVFRYDNIVVEFKQYGISDLLRNIVGASKISLATILLLAICYDGLPLVEASLGMAFFMLCAQIAHIKVKNPIKDVVPAITMLSIGLIIFSHAYAQSI